MSKRHINKQQSARINTRQARYYHQNQSALVYEDGLVITRFNKQVDIEDKKGKRIRCFVRPNIDSLVAGDRVIWQYLGENQGIIISRYPRQTVLERANNRHSNQYKPIAANISQLIVVIAAKPKPNWLLLDSYLVIAENLHLQLSIVLNKVDLPCLTLKKNLIQNYHNLGYPILFTCQNNLYGYDKLQQALCNHSSVFVGQSGVGKSSLIANILPHENNIVTANLSKLYDLGCHTTNHSYLYHLPQGGALIDSPGIREFNLRQMTQANILYGFREFRDLTYSCKFRNCTHKDSPGCALINAITQGQASKQRYENLITLSMSFANDY